MWQRLDARIAAAGPSDSWRARLLDTLHSLLLAARGARGGVHVAARDRHRLLCRPHRLRRSPTNRTDARERDGDARFGRLCGRTPARHRRPAVDCRQQRQRRPVGNRDLAASLVDSNRLYAQAATRSGNTRLADFLRQLEPVLLELANQSPDTAVQSIDGLRDYLKKTDLLFQVRATQARIDAAGKHST
jgi:hypothetical protein